MIVQRRFEVARYLQPTDGEPIRSVVHASAHATIVAWTVKPGQRIAPHVHPQGEDVWTVLSGRGHYQTDAEGRTVPIGPGDVLSAPQGAVHGVLAEGAEPLVFVSVVCPAEAGYAPL